MNPASHPSPSPSYANLMAFLRFWPLHMLIICAVWALGGPTLQAARLAWVGGVEGGVQVNTGGASGAMSGGRYMLDLPVEIVNGGSGMVLGVNLWVETFGCPSETARTSACRPLTSFEQNVPARIQPGGFETSHQSLPGVAPGPGEVIRIERKLEAIDDGAPTNN